MLRLKLMLPRKLLLLLHQHLLPPPHPRLLLPLHQHPPLHPLPLPHLPQHPLLHQHQLLPPQLPRLRPPERLQSDD